MAIYTFKKKVTKRKKISVDGPNQVIKTMQSWRMMALFTVRILLFEESPKNSKMHRKKRHVQGEAAK